MVFTQYDLYSYICVCCILVQCIFKTKFSAHDIEAAKASVVFVKMKANKKVGSVNQFEPKFSGSRIKNLKLTVLHRHFQIVNLIQ